MGGEDIVLLCVAAMFFGFVVGACLDHRGTRERAERAEKYAYESCFLAFHGWKPDQARANQWTYWAAPDQPETPRSFRKAMERQQILNKATDLHVPVHMLTGERESRAPTYTPEGWR